MGNTVLIDAPGIAQVFAQSNAAALNLILNNEKIDMATCGVDFERNHQNGCCLHPCEELRYESFVEDPNSTYTLCVIVSFVENSFAITQTRELLDTQHIMPHKGKCQEPRHSSFVNQT